MYDLVDFHVCPFSLKLAFIDDIMNLGLSILLTCIGIEPKRDFCKYDNPQYKVTILIPVEEFYLYQSWIWEW